MYSTVLKKLGYRIARVPKSPNTLFKEICHLKIFSTPLGEFTVKLKVEDELMIDLPKAYIHALPAALEGKAIPHVRWDSCGSGFLCYVESEEINWSPDDLGTTLKLVDQCIEETLQRIACTIDDCTNNYQDDFLNYWSASTTAFVSSDSPDATVVECETLQGVDVINGELRGKELLVINDEQTMRRWLKARAGKLTEASLKKGTDNIRPIHSVFAKITTPYIPKDTIFPIKSFKEFFDFIFEVDSSAGNTILQSMKKKLADGGTRVCVFIEVDGGYIGFFVSYIGRIRYALFGSSKNKINPRNGSIRTILSCNALIKKSFPLACVNAKEDYIIRRNATSSNTLQNKKVALIGAGTIGGYAAQSLVQIGAGGGELGRLDVYDPDVYGTQNLSRHILPISYLGWSKPLALCNHLSLQYPQGIKNKYFNRKFSNKDLVTRHYDLIIDATGKVPLPMMLRDWVRGIANGGKRPIIIHGWIDGHGAAARVLIDDGKVCYRCVMESEIDNAKPQRFPIFKGKHQPPTTKHSRVCGAVYTPYESAISSMCASLIQSAALRILKNERWNFAQLSTSEHVLPVPMKTIQPLKTCKCNAAQ